MPPLLLPPSPPERPLAERTPELRIALLAAESNRQADGIRDYAERLLRALIDAGLPASLLLWRDGGWYAADGGELPDELDAVVLQYNPFSFGRRGFAPKLPLSLRGFRRRGRPLVGLMCHETYVDMKNPKWVLMGSWQRLQLIALQRVTDVQFCTIQRYVERLERTAGSRPVHHLPVASNLPDARANRDATRAALGVDGDALLLSCLGMRHPGRRAEHVMRDPLQARQHREADRSDHHANGIEDTADDDADARSGEERVEQVVLERLPTVRLVGLDARAAFQVAARKDPTEEMVERTERANPAAEHAPEHQRQRHDHE